MNKLFKLKRWLTVPEAARHLSIVLGEEVCDSDVLRLALDGHLQLSVDFVNGALARIGKIIPIEEAKRVPGIPLRRDGKPCEPYEIVLGLKVNDEEVLQFDEKVVSIQGIWDLCMIGGERLDVEHKYYQDVSGVAVESINLDGSFVKREDELYCQLQESYETNEFMVGSEVYLRKWETQMALDNIGPSEAKVRLDGHKEERKQFLAERKARKDAGRDSENYFPAGGLLDDSVLIVRTDALRGFEESISEKLSAAEKPLTTRERNTLLTIIAGLCDYSGINCQERGAAGQIAKMIEKIGVAVTDDTIRKVLSKIPDAVEARLK